VEALAGKMQRVLLFLCLAVATAVAQQQGCSADLDIAFVVDSSGSIQDMDPNGWQRVKTFIIQVIRNFKIGPSNTRVGLTVYSEFATRSLDDPRVGDDAIGFFDLTTFQDSASLENAINRLYYYNSLTNTQDGINVASNVIFTPPGDRPNIQNLAIVITDGESNVNKERVEEEAARLKEKATVVAVGVSNAQEAELKIIASNDDLVLRVTDFQALEKELDRIVSSVCGIVIPREDPGRCCDFDGEYEGTFCDFQQDGISRFSLQKGASPSLGTGPEAAESGFYYAYLEASNLDLGDNAELWWTNIGVNGTCLSFYYNMYGGHLGQLFVEIREGPNEDWIDVFNVTEATETGWTEAAIELNVLISDLRFRAVRGPGYQGDIALDTVRLAVGPCYLPEPEPQNDTANDTCPEPQAPVPPPPPVIFYPFFQPPGAAPPLPPPPPPPVDEDEEEEEVDLTKNPECQVSEPFQVLIVGGPDATVGRLEIYYNRTFGTVCNTTFFDNEADAACRAAGFFGGRVLRNLGSIQPLRPNDEKTIHLDNVRCKAGSDFDDCCRSRWGKVSCNHAEDVYVRCDDKPAYCAPRTERSPPIPADADLSLCDRNAPAFSVVLRGGSKANEGRVEIYYDGQFGTVCNDTFGVKEAMAVCKSLGYYAGNVWLNPPEDLRLAQGVDRPVLLSGVRCEEDSELRDCCYNAVGFEDGCTHSQDVFVRCYDRPEYCYSKTSGCASPPQLRERPVEEPEEEEPEPPKPPQPPLPQVFPIPVNPFFSLPFGQQLPFFPNPGFVVPPNGNAQPGGD
jgi:hypothetical protein